MKNAMGSDTERFRDTVELLPQVVFELDEQGNFTFVNAHVKLNLGYTQEDIVKGIHATDTVVPEDRPKIRKEVDNVLKGLRSEKGTETSILRRDGSRFPAMIFAAPIVKEGRTVGVRGIVVDISDRKQIEEQLREREEQYRLIVENTHVGIAIMDNQFRIICVNSELCRMSGFTQDELLGNDVIDFVGKETKERARDLFIRRQRGEAVPSSYEAYILTKSGGELLVEARAALFRTSSGPPQTLVQLLNITEKRKTEESLRNSEALYRTVFDHTGTVMAIVEEDLTISLVNDEFEHLVGYSRKEVEGKMKSSDFVLPEDLAMFLDMRKRRAADSGDLPKSYELRMAAKDGAVKNVWVTATRIPGTKRTVTSLIDVTDLKQMGTLLADREKELETNGKRLEELNEALKILLKHKQEDQGEFEKKILSNVRELVQPYLLRLKETQMDVAQKTFVDIIETNLNEIMSPFLRTLTSQYLNFTPKEIQVANYIKSGKKTKDIARMMSVTTSAVDLHRNHIRSKLGLNKKKVNLRTYLSTLV